jgi:Tfp pilus assembly protein PilN
MRAKKIIFILSLAENSLKILKCQLQKAKRTFLDLAVETLPENINEKALAEKLKLIFKSLNYKQHPLIVSLSRSQATFRFLIVPTQAPEEIEKIIYLQAAKYLPYPADELISAYQTILTDKEGYAQINLIMVHKNAIERYLNLFQEMNIKDFQIVLGSYGLSNLYHFIRPQDPAPVMLMDINSQQAELVIASGRKLYYSRYFKFNKDQPDLEAFFNEEINKTKEAYLKEVRLEPPAKIILLETTNKQIPLSIERLNYLEKIKFPEDLRSKIIHSQTSFVPLIGLGLEDLPSSLDLLPAESKEKKKRACRYNEQLHLTLWGLGIILVWIAIFIKALDNQALYLGRIKDKLNKITKEAKPLEDMENRLRLLNAHTQKKWSSLSLLSEIHKLLPPEASLASLSYDARGELVLRGQAQDLSRVFSFVAQLEGSPLFKQAQVKVRYASKIKIKTAEVVDFEIICLQEEKP